MKILLISSGYGGIYDHFESWIIEELRKKHEIVFFQIKSGLRSLQAITRTFQPDLALTLVGFKIPVHFHHWFKQQKIKTAVWFTEDPYYMDQTSQLSQYYDFIFTIDSAAMEYYRKNGHTQAYLLPLATEPNIFKPKEVSDRYKSDICFVGYPYPERIKYIQLLLDKTPYKICLIGKWKKFVYPFIRNPNLLLHEGWVEPSIAANYYNGAKIVLNSHRPYNLKQNQNRIGIEGKTINNRTFDVASCEVFQLVDFKDDLPKFFIENEEIIAYRNNEELVNKTIYYMENESERKRIATNGKKRVLQEHTFEHRLKELITIVLNSLSKTK